MRQYCFFSGIGKSSQITKMAEEGRLNYFLMAGIDIETVLEKQKSFKIYLLSEVNQLKDA